MTTPEWENDILNRQYDENVEQTTKEIISVLSGGVPQSVKIRVSELRTIDADAAALLEMLNFSEEETALIIASLITEDQIVAAGGKKLVGDTIKDIAHMHAQFTAEDAVRKRKEEITYEAAL